MNAFKAYDIRGIYNKDFNKEDAYKIGRFLISTFHPKTVLIGRDIRNSSDEIFEALSRGITEAGADVADAGLCTTPMIYYLTAKQNYDLSVMITASHNSAEYNGMKVSGPKATPIGYDDGLHLIEEKMQMDEAFTVHPKPGCIKKVDFREDYLDFQKKYQPKLDGLKLAVDCSNGMAGFFIRDLLGDAPYYINENPDGNFPGHNPNPLVAENVVQLQDTVKKHDCDLGLIFDGDADRVMFVDEKGQFISPDLIIALLGHYFLEGKEKGQKVLQDIRTSKAVGEYLQQFGAEMHTWRVGRAYAAKKLREISGLYGGELAGHYYFSDFYDSDSGILAALIVLGIVKKFKEKGKSLSSLIQKIGTYINSGEINFKIEHKADAMKAVKKHFEQSEEVLVFMDFDGYRMEFKDWWLNIRPSNTEPYLRFLAEAKDAALLEEKVSKVREIIGSFE